LTRSIASNILLGFSFIHKYTPYRESHAVLFLALHNALQYITASIFAADAYIACFRLIISFFCMLELAAPDFALAAVLQCSSDCCSKI
jgi:hypothetical protein